MSGLANAATLALDEALSAVQGRPELARRVRVARLPLENLWLRMIRPLHSVAEETGMPYLGPDDREEAIEAFAQNARELKTYWDRERRTIPAYLAWLRGFFERSDAWERERADESAKPEEKGDDADDDKNDEPSDTKS